MGEKIELKCRAVLTLDDLTRWANEILQNSPLNWEVEEADLSGKVQLRGEMMLKEEKGELLVTIPVQFELVKKIGPFSPMVNGRILLHSAHRLSVVNGLPVIESQAKEYEWLDEARANWKKLDIPVHKIADSAFNAYLPSVMQQVDARIGEEIEIRWPLLQTSMRRNLGSTLDKFEYGKMDLDINQLELDLLDIAILPDRIESLIALHMPQLLTILLDPGKTINFPKQSIQENKQNA